MLVNVDNLPWTYRPRLQAMNRSKKGDSAAEHVPTFLHAYFKSERVPVLNFFCTRVFDAQANFVTWSDPVAIKPQYRPELLRRRILLTS